MDLEFWVQPTSTIAGRRKLLEHLHQLSRNSRSTPRWHGKCTKSSAAFHGRKSHPVMIVNAMILTEDQLKELERRCDTTLTRKTLREQREIMGNYLNTDHKTLPEPIREKFCKVLSSMAIKTFTR